MCANNGSDDEDECGGVGYNDSDNEAGYGGVGYDGDGVDKKMPAKRAAPIILMRNMASKFLNWEYTLHFNTTPRAEEKTFVNLLYYVNHNPKIISKEYQAECIQNEFPLDSLFQFPSLYQFTSKRKMVYFTCLGMNQAASTKYTPIKPM
jgi:hypothetical protein